MVALTYDNRLETRLIQDKKPEPPKDNSEAVVKVVGAVILILILKITGVLDITISPGDPISLPIRPSPLPTNPITVAPAVPEMPPGATPTSGRKVQINPCYGSDYYAGANFRDYPARTPLTIRGVVLEGQLVTLTGEMTDPNTDPDGIKWYRVINDFALEESEELNAQNQTDANQTGWIADCFIEE